MSNMVLLTLVKQGWARRMLEIVRAYSHKCRSFILDGLGPASIIQQWILSDIVPSLKHKIMRISGHFVSGISWECQKVKCELHRVDALPFVEARVNFIIVHVWHGKCCEFIVNMLS